MLKKSILVMALLGAAPALARDAQKPAQAAPASPSPATVDMDAWETQVLGSICGTYCGYYPTRVTLVGRSVGISSFGQCQKVFDETQRNCVGRAKAEGRWHVATSEEGTVLGRSIGECIDDGFARFAARTKK